MMDLYREMLIKLDKMITKDELTRMKLYTKDLIATRLRDQIDSCVTLWERLEERRKIGPNDVSYIKNLIRNCTDNRQDLIDVILEYEQVSINNASRSSTSITECTSSRERADIREEIQYLVDNLGRDWKFFMRALGLDEAALEMCIESNSRNVREQIHSAFAEWQKKGVTNHKQSILRALKEVKRNDLFYKLETGTFKS